MNKQNEVIIIGETDDEENAKLIFDIDDVKSKDISNHRKHIYWIDALRVFSSYMVVLVHCCFYGRLDYTVFSKNWYGARFWNAICRPCVPLFVMISGVLFLDPKRNISISKIYKKYIFSIAKTLLFWNIIYVTIDKFAIMGINKEYTYDKDLLFAVYKDFVGGRFHLWYLYMCIGLYALTPFVRHLCKEEMLMKYFLVISVILVQLIPFLLAFAKNCYPSRYFDELDVVLEKFKMSMVGGYTSIYILGYYLNSLTISKPKLYIIYFVGGANSLLTYLLQIIFSKKYKNEIKHFDDYFRINIVLPSIAIFLFFKYPLHHLIENRGKFFKTTLKRLSGYTMGIYVLHICWIDLLFEFRIKYYNKNQFFFTSYPCLISMDSLCRHHLLYEKDSNY